MNHIDFIFYYVDDLMLDNMFHILDQHLQSHIVMYCTDLGGQLAWLTASLPAKSKLPNRHVLVDLLKRQHGEELLRGLE